MRVIVYDLYVFDEKFKKYGVEKVDFDIFLKEFDLIIIYILKIKEMYNFILEKEFKKMKKGVRIVNCVCGGVINENDFYNVIKEGIVAAAVFDVFEKELNFEFEK